MARIFKTPFGAQGDTEQVPEAPQGDGSVSLTQGFGYDYEREYEDPAAKDIRREIMNGILHDITGAIGDIQLSGIAKWNAAAAPYPAGAVVWYSDVAWMSTAGNNSSVPGAGSWKAVDLSSSIRLSEPIDQAPSANNVQEALASLGAFAGDGYQNIAVFDTAGATDWSVPDALRQGLRKAHVTVVGGGGGGGKHTSVGGGGGGGGGVSESILDLNGVSSVTVTVGIGGSGRGIEAPGIAGGTSSFGNFLSATGGSGGESSSTSSQGGASGVGSGGQLNFGLGPGGRSLQITNDPTYSGGIGGGIGGGRGANVDASPPVAPGAGGGGAATGSASDGKAGIVIVRW